jgi:hypothetical protein
MFIYLPQNVVIIIHILKENLFHGRNDITWQIYKFLVLFRKKVLGFIFIFLFLSFYILYFVFLSLFFVYGKNIPFIPHTWNIYHFTFDLFIPSFFAFILFFCNFFYLYFLKKLLYKTKSKWCFAVVIATLFYFFIILKINLKSYMFLLTYMIFILFYYI